MVCPKAVPETLSAADTAYSADKGAINLTSGNQTDRPLLEFFVGHPDGVHSRGRLSWAVAPGLISGDRVGVSA